jgi:hypothetical protein
MHRWWRMRCGCMRGGAHTAAACVAAACMATHAWRRVSWTLPANLHALLNRRPRRPRRHPAQASPASSLACCDTCAPCAGWTRTKAVSHGVPGNGMGTGSSPQTACAPDDAAWCGRLSLTNHHYITDAMRAPPARPRLRPRDQHALARGRERAHAPGERPLGLDLNLDLDLEVELDEVELHLSSGHWIGPIRRRGRPAQTAQQRTVLAPPHAACRMPPHDVFPA